MSRLAILVHGTTDVEEVCILGYNKGYMDGKESQSEQPIMWPIDTPVLVRNSEEDPWVLRYFYDVGKDGRIITFSGGTNSNDHYYGEMSLWKYAKLAKYTLHSEIELIQDVNLRDFAHFCETEIPEYFYHIPASSSGKYHPAYALGDAGLLRHTKAAVKIAEDLLSLEQYKNSDYLNHDVIIFSLIFHDCVKQGFEESGSGHTEFLHPNYASNFIKDCYEKYKSTHDAKFYLATQVVQIRDCIESHMGQWNTSKYEKEVKLQKPMTIQQEFVHMCDYLASRKYIEINFDSE